MISDFEHGVFLASMTFIATGLMRIANELKLMRINRETRSYTESAAWDSSADETFGEASSKVGKP